MSEKMTKSERTELGQLIRKRERVMKSLAVERSAAMLAEFDAQLSSIYSYDDDETWKQAHDEAEKVIEESNERIAKRCGERGRGEMASLKSAIRETKEYLQLNVDADATDDDAVDYLSDECGQDQNGLCSLAGTEYCDWECPFSS